MPELPEVETIARQLDKVLRGQVVKAVEVRKEKSFEGNKKLVVGKKIVKVGRKAKMVVMELEGGLFLLIHLKMTGQLVYRQELKGKRAKGKINIAGGHPTVDWVAELPSKHTRVIFELSRGKLFFNDQRVFGWVKVVDGEELGRELKRYGLDVIDKRASKKYFFEALQSSKRAVKLVIMDQAKVAGVGNIYANDGLWCAGIDPRRSAKEITRAESDKLWACLRKLVRKGIKYGGATASDDSYVNALGLGGRYQEHFLVYEREGEKCNRCKGVIEKIRLGGRGTYYCPGCQR